MKELAFYIFVVLFVGCMTLGIVAGSAYFESRAFENATGKKVSVWDAMFIELRVQEGTNNN